MQDAVHIDLFVQFDFIARHAVADFLLRARCHGRIFFVFHDLFVRFQHDRLELDLAVGRARFLAVDGNGQRAAVGFGDDLDRFVGVVAENIVQRAVVQRRIHAEIDVGDFVCMDIAGNLIHFSVQRRHIQRGADLADPAAEAFLHTAVLENGRRFIALVGGEQLKLFKSAVNAVIEIIGVYRFFK